MCVLLAFLLALRADALYPFGLDSRVDTFFPAYESQVTGAHSRHSD